MARFGPKVTEGCRRVVSRHCAEVTHGNPAQFEWCRRFGYGSCEVDPHAAMQNIERAHVTARLRRHRGAETPRGVRGMGQPPPVYAYRDGVLGAVTLNPTYAMVGMAAVVGIAAGYALSRAG